MDDPYAWLERQPELRIARDPATLPAPASPRPPIATSRRSASPSPTTPPLASPRPISRSTPAAATIATGGAATSRPFTVREEVRPAAADVRDYFGRLLTRAGRAGPLARARERPPRRAVHADHDRLPRRRRPTRLPQHRAPHARGIRRRRPSPPDRRRDAQRDRQPQPRLPAPGPRVRLRLRPLRVRARCRQPRGVRGPGTTRRAAASRSRVGSNPFLGGTPCESRAGRPGRVAGVAATPHRCRRGRRRHPHLGARQPHRRAVRLRIQRGGVDRGRRAAPCRRPAGRRAATSPALLACAETGTRSSFAARESRCARRASRSTSTCTPRRSARIPSTAN